MNSDGGICDEDFNTSSESNSTARMLSSDNNNALIKNL